MSDRFIQSQGIRSYVKDYFQVNPNSEKGSNSKYQDSEDESSEDEYQESESSESSSESSESSSESSEEENEKNEKNDPNYTYLDSNDPTLHYEFGLCIDNRDITKQYLVHICGYQRVNGFDEPFIKYLMQLEKTAIQAEYTFPSFYFKCSTNVQLDWEEEMSPEHVYFKNECMKRVLDLLDENVDTDVDDNRLANIYKGFIAQNHGQEEVVYVFFDFTGFHLPDSSPKKSWILIDEILHKPVLGYPINQRITELFEYNESLAYMRDKKFTKIEYPRVLYMCEWRGSTYENIYKTEDGTISLIDERIDHPILGNFYIFSVNPLEGKSQKPIDSIARYAVQIQSPKYIFYPFTKKLEATFQLSSVIPTAVDYLYKKSETEDIDRSKEKTQIEKELDEVVNLPNQSIFFQEMVGDKKTPFWCIKSSSDFMEI